MSETQYHHRLDGLEPDNLLAFLALLGLLRALETVRPEWRPRAAWALDEPPLRPILALAEPVSQQLLCEQALAGLKIFHKALLPFSWPRSKQGKAIKTAICSDPRRFKALANRISRSSDAASERCNRHTQLLWSFRNELLAATAVESWNIKGYGLEQSPLKLPSGQMSFIGTMFESIRQCRVVDLKNSLFEDWQFVTKGDSLRLAHQEARRYAYRATDPSPEGARSERGATALAALGLLAFRLVPGKNGAITMGYSGRRQSGFVYWPIWADADRRGTSYFAIVALLGAFPPGTGEDRIDLPPEVVGYMRTARFVLDPRKGDYGNVDRAEVTWVKS